VDKLAETIKMQYLSKDVPQNSAREFVLKYAAKEKCVEKYMKVFKELL
jgi:hypothetical protein